MQGHLNFLVQSCIYHFLQVVLRFYLLEQNSKSNVLEEGYGKLLAVEHSLLINDMDQNMRVLMVLLRLAQIIDKQLMPLVLPVSVIDHFFER